MTGRNYDDASRIARLESQVAKQQAEINQLIIVNENVAKSVDLLIVYVEGLRRGIE